MTYIQAKCLSEDGEVLGQGEGELKRPFKLEVVNLPQLDITLGLRIVNLPGKSCDEKCNINKEELQKYLNDVYRSAVVNVEVHLLETMECDYDLPDSEGIKDGLFNRFASLTSDEPGLIHNSCNATNMGMDKVLYIIGNPILKKFGTHTNPSGTSIVTGKYGFVYPSISKNLMGTIAHELGHLIGIKRHKIRSEEVDHVMYEYTRETLPKVLTYFSEWREIKRDQ